ncbi:MAG: 5-formyltetrahydrofolate cyclo-ligase [Clostridiales bacterium]|nr:5-formyltetrahydrofolate cyclo-ligase [Clostridiales bacterium]
MSVNPQDMRQVKQELRKEYTNIRKSYSPERKKQLDVKVTRRLLNLWAFREAGTVLCYVSSSLEVDTGEIIKTALSMGKSVAVPRCGETARSMDFYFINSLDELSAQHFGILEPEADESRKLTDLSNGFCIVPGLSFDVNGFRLGFGGGYYDKFLEEFRGVSAGLCYEDCIAKKLPRGRYDKSINMVVTENRFYRNN